MFIRKAPIDELPQLFNIIKGNITFIGSRILAITDEKVIELGCQNDANLVSPEFSELEQFNG